METVLEARGLVKAFRGAPAVDGVDLTLAAGERVALLGPNGAGKTTTLLMLLGAVTPDRGTVDVLGHRLPGGRSRAMEGVGFGAGYLPLPDRLRVGEALGVFARLYGLARPEAAVGPALERFGIPHLARAFGAELSTGQRTLVTLVKATMHRPRLLVLDEPTAGLDPHVAHQARAGLERLCVEDGTTLLVTSHDMSEVERMCGRVVFMAAGRVVADGAPRQVAGRFGQASLGDVFVHLAAGEPG